MATSGSSSNLGLRRRRRRLVHSEAEHHPALSVFCDMAVSHPKSGVRNVKKDIDGLSRPKQHGVLPHEIGLDLAIP